MPWCQSLSPYWICAISRVRDLPLQRLKAVAFARRRTLVKRGIGVLFLEIKLVFRPTAKLLNLRS